MGDDEREREDAKFQALFEGQRSGVLNNFKDATDSASALTHKKLENAAARKSFTSGEGSGQGRRLPPGRSQSAEWPVLDLGDKPAIDHHDWTLSIAGLVERPVQWDWNTFMVQPQVELKSDIHCVTAWSRFDNTWQGVSANHLLSVVRPLPQAQYLVIHGYDGYTANVPLERFSADNVVLAHHWQGAPITREHGGPVRVVIPDLYFWKSAKWVRHMVFLEHEVKGYWETRGYHNNGDPWKEQRYE